MTPTRGTSRALSGVAAARNAASQEAGVKWHGSHGWVQAFEVKSGRLFLFYRDPSIDAHALWLKERDGLFEKAEKNWPSLAN